METLTQNNNIQPNTIVITSNNKETYDNHNISPTAHSLSLKSPQPNPHNLPIVKLKENLIPLNNYEEAYYNSVTWCRDRWRTAINL
jgi:hypothetical protein